MYECILTGNISSGSGSGGGAGWSTLYNCDIVSNISGFSGGGAHMSVLNNCIIAGNTSEFGGGAYGGDINNCTVVGNVASLISGGVRYATNVNNCIVVGNYRTNGVVENWSEINITRPMNFNSSCTFPMPTNGTGNLTNNPLFIDPGGGYGTNWTPGDYRLQSNSPCIDLGNNSYMPPGPDVMKIPRPLDGDADSVAIVDMGSYEYCSIYSDTDSDGLSDAAEVTVYDTNPVMADTDGDGMKDGAEVPP